MRRDGIVGGAGTLQAGLLAQDDRDLRLPTSSSWQWLFALFLATTNVHHSGASAAEFHRLPTSADPTGSDDGLRSRLQGMATVAREGKDSIAVDEILEPLESDM